MQPQIHQASMLPVAMYQDVARKRQIKQRFARDSKSIPSVLTRILDVPRAHSNTGHIIASFPFD